VRCSPRCTHARTMPVWQSLASMLRDRYARTANPSPATYKTRGHPKTLEPRLNSSPLCRHRGKEGGEGRRSREVLGGEEKGTAAARASSSQRPSHDHAAAVLPPPRRLAPATHHHSVASPCLELAGKPSTALTIPFLASLCERSPPAASRLWLPRGPCPRGRTPAGPAQKLSHMAA
jgi:hypothetical protein